MQRRFLLENWSEVAQRVHRVPGLAVFLDFDGTLTPHVAHPTLATMDHSTRAAISKLAAHPRVKVCIVSGRRRADVRERVNVPGIHYLGAHGWERKTSGVLSDATAERLAEAQKELAKRINGSAGVHIEDKGISFALHYRGALHASARAAGTMLGELMARYRGTLRSVSGDKVWEVLPAEIRGKGYAVRKQWRAWGRDTLPIYIGNDATDEGAFLALSRGVTARVGPACPTRAHYYLRNPAEVRKVLRLLAEEVHSLDQDRYHSEKCASPLS